MWFITLCLTFWGTARLFSKADAPFYIPTSDVCRFQFLHILSILVIVWLFDYCLSTGCEVVSHCGFICISLMSKDFEHLFMCFLAIFVYFWRKFYSYLLPVFILGYFLLLSFKSSFYILDTSPLSGMWFAIIFSHWLGCLHFLDGVLLEEKFLILMKSSLFFILLPLLLVSYLKSHC